MTDTMEQPTPTAVPVDQMTLKRLLFQAIRDNEGKVVQYMLRTFVETKSLRDDDGKTPLFVAAEANAVEAIDALLKSNVNVNEFIHGESALFFAVRAKASDAVRFLLRRGAYTDDRNPRGNMPLHEAVVAGDIDIITDLVQNGASINEKDADGATPVFLCVKHKRVDILRILLLNLADPDLCDKWGIPPILKAITSNAPLDIIDLLLEHGTITNINETYETLTTPGMVNLKKIAVAECVSTRLLFAAIESNRPAIVEFLLHTNELPTYKNSDGLTPLYVAAIENAVPVMRALVSSGFDVNDASSKGRETALLGAVRFKSQEAITYLLRHGADVHAKNDDGDTVLHIAAHSGCDVDRLLDHGARINEQNAKGETPVFIAVFYQHLDVLHTLLRRGANANLSDHRGVVPMTIVLTTEIPERFIELLLNYRACDDFYAMLEWIVDDDLTEHTISSINMASLTIILRHHMKTRRQQKGHKRIRSQSDGEDDVVVVSSTFMCKICTVKEVQVTLAPCGHRALCVDCVQTVLHQPCPFCREPVQSFIRKEYVV